ncbi:agmatinase family protein [Pseudohongiella sp.]|uniref:Arginase n=1 Tax=marine sediment metagenome TaxID=412755 RepID=A0A0F9W5Z1_9ZZZZ|nr:agmatinase family protein [Pseudohongiella sp.]HDZ08228.1 arginase [Pseudohongiella sp.]HEA63196.1 arginase [Pseudohongiella sp.]
MTIRTNRHLVSALALSMFVAAHSSTLSAQARIPSEVRAKLELLTDDQIAFLGTDQPLRVIPSREKLYQDLERRTPEQVEQYVSDMIEAVEAHAFRPGIDMANIPLNPEASRFNGFKVVQPEILKERLRDPGPVNVHRYINQWAGIPTFAGAPVAVTPEDLIAGNVEVAIAGIPQSMSSGSRDGRNAPNVLRAMHVTGNLDVYAMVDPGAVLNIVDYGDIAVDRMSLERGLDHVYDMVLQMANTGAVPFLVGGDHSLMYPNVKAVQAADPDQSLTVVHFGANYNAERTRAHTISDRDAVYRLVSEGVIDGSDLIQVGLRGSQATRESFEWLRDNDVRYHTMASVEANGWQEVMEQIVEEASDAGNPLYLSLDVSVLDPTEMVAAGRAVPGGLTIREVTPLLRRLCAENEVAGLELMDFAPMLDLSYVSAMNANYMLNACLTGIAMRKQGITEENYLDPTTVDHGQN